MSSTSTTRLKDGTVVTNQVDGNGVQTATWKTITGKTYSSYDAYIRGILEERQNNATLFENAKTSGLIDQPDSDAGNTGDGLLGTATTLLDKNFENTSKLMGLTNQYRTKEGATQGQMDEQSFRRMKTQLDTQERMQVTGADLQERQRQYDNNRAVKAFRGKF